MVVDELGCVVMQQNGDGPGGYGDSCAESGRYIVFTMNRDVFLRMFATDAGFVRHPRSPWREDTFTSDQMIPLLMGARLKSTDKSAPSWAVEHGKSKGLLPWRTGPGKTSNIATIFLTWEWYQLFAVTTVAQMLINKIPFRWHDGHEYDAEWSWFRRKFWRFTSSKNMTVSYLTVATECVFLYRMGIKWPFKLLNKDVYYGKVLDYYKPEPNSEWFTYLIGQALFRPERM